MAIKVLFVHHGKGWGGAPKSLSLLLSHLDRQKIDPWVLCLHPGKAVDVFTEIVGKDHIILDEKMSDLSHTVQEWYPVYKPSFLRWLSRLFRSRRTKKRMAHLIDTLHPDIVHLNSTALLFHAQAAHSKNIPVVWHVREPLSPGHVGLRYGCLRSQIRKLASRIVAISKNDGHPFLDLPKAAVVYNPVNDEPAMNRKQMREKISIPESVKLAGYIGSAGEKGLFEFLEAARSISKTNPDIRFMVVGLNPEKIKDASVPLVSVDPAVAAEFSKNPESAMVGMDVVVVPYAIPHFSRVILEAGGVGVPVIAYSWGGAEEIIDDGKTGILVPPLDQSKLQKAILYLLASDDLRQKMGKAAHEKIRTLSGARNHAKKIEEIYSELRR